MVVDGLAGRRVGHCKRAVATVDLIDDLTGCHVGSWNGEGQRHWEVFGRI